MGLAPAGLLLAILLCLITGLAVGIVFRLILPRRLSVSKALFLSASGTAGVLLFSMFPSAKWLTPLEMMIFSALISVIVLTIYSIFSIFSKPKVSSNPSLAADIAALLEPKTPVSMPTPQPQQNLSNNSVATLVAPPMPPPTQLSPNRSQDVEKHEFQIKVCPTCKKTYTDISLNFCLDDGATLSGVIQARASHDPDETVLSPKFR